MKTLSFGPSWLANPPTCHLEELWNPFGSRKLSLRLSRTISPTSGLARLKRRALSARPWSRTRSRPHSRLTFSTSTLSLDPIRKSGCCPNWPLSREGITSPLRIRNGRRRSFPASRSPRAQVEARPWEGNKVEQAVRGSFAFWTFFLIVQNLYSHNSHDKEANACDQFDQVVAQVIKEADVMVQ